MMASPQTETGHTQIANEILEHLARAYLSPNQWQVLMFIICKTYGYKNKADYLSNSQIVEATGLTKSTVSRAVKNLVNNNIIIRRGKYIGFQKDWKQWECKVNSIGNSEKLAGLTTLGSKLAGQPTIEKLAEQPTKVSYPIAKKGHKSAYGEFNNVLLTDEEYKKLEEKFGTRAQDLVEKLSAGIESKGYKYKSHYATILNWERRDKGGNHETNKRNTRQLPTEFTDPEEFRLKTNRVGTS